MANLKDLIVNGSARVLGTIYGNLTGNATTATTATKLGTATVGSTLKPIYLNAGTATAISATVGTTITPIYLNGGTPTALSYTIAKSVPADANFSNTTYSAGTGLSLSGTTFNHTESVTAGTVGTSAATSGSTLAVPYVTYNATGHITATGTHTHTVSGFLTGHQTIKQDCITGATANRYVACSTAAATAAKTGNVTAGTFALEAGASVKVKFANANTADSPTLNINSKGAKNIFHKGAQITTGSNKALLAGVCEFLYDGTQWHLVGNYIDANTTYSAGSGLYLSGTTFNHSATITAGTQGTSTASSGSTLTVPYVTYNATGHITAAGTRTHTVTGFLTGHQTIKNHGVTGATINTYAACSIAAATAAKTASITSGTFALEAGSRVFVKFANANTANSPTLNINSTGAKNIFNNGAQITTGGNKALLKGICEFVYDGTQYHLVGNYIDNNTTYSAGTGLSLSSTTINHISSITAGTVGTSAATSGSTLAVPYVTYNDTGHITATGTHTHTVSGFAASSHNQAANTITAMTGYSKASASAAISTSDSLNKAIGKLEYKVDQAVSGGNVKISQMNGSSLTPTNPTATVTVSATNATVTVKGQTWNDGDNDFTTDVLDNVSTDSTITVTIVTHSSVRAYLYNSHYYSRDTLADIT